MKLKVTFARKLSKSFVFAFQIHYSQLDKSNKIRSKTKTHSTDSVVLDLLRNQDRRKIIGKKANKRH